MTRAGLNLFHGETGDPGALRTAAGTGSRRAWLSRALGLGASLAGGGLTGCALAPTARAPALPGAAPTAPAGAHAGSAGTATQLPSAPTAASPEPVPAARVLPFSTGTLGTAPTGWLPYAMRRDLTRTHYAVVHDGQRRVLNARAAASATGLRCAVDIDPAAFGHLQFSWRVHNVPTQANVAAAEHDDCPARIIVAFGGDDTRLPLRDRLFFEQVELFTGQRLPFATLMYVWDGGGHAPETVHRNHRTARIQYLTVESGAQRAGRWLHYERDVVADYRRVFGEAPGNIVGVGVLTDADALKIDLEAWYGDITLASTSARVSPAPARAAPAPLVPRAPSAGTG